MWDLESNSFGLQATKFIELIESGDSLDAYGIGNYRSGYVVHPHRE